MQTCTLGFASLCSGRLGKIPRRFFEPCLARLSARRTRTRGGPDVSEAQLPACRATPVRPPAGPNALCGQDSRRAGPLFANESTRKSTTRRPADPDIEYTRIDAGAAHGVEVRNAVRQLPHPDRLGSRRLTSGAPALSGCQKNAGPRKSGVTKMIDQSTARPASRHRSATGYHRAAALHSSGRHASTGFQSAPGGRRIRQIATHAHPAHAFSFVDTVRKGMCARAPVPLRPIFAF